MLCELVRVGHCFASQGTHPFACRQMNSINIMVNDDYIFSYLVYKLFTFQNILYLLGAKPLLSQM